MAICAETRKQSPDHIMNGPFHNAKVGDCVDWNSISALEKDSFRGGIYLVFKFHVTYASDNEAVVEMHIGMQGVLFSG